MSRPTLIGLAGMFASGKDTLAKRLHTDYGFSVANGGDFIRKLAMERHGSIERPLLRETADYYRQTMGANAILDMQIADYESSGADKGLIINGLRALGEAKTIKSKGGILVFVDAPLEVRYQRMIDRNRDAEVQLTIEEFAANEQKEWHAGDRDADFNLRDIKAMADIVIDSNQPIEDFIAAAYDALNVAS